MTPDDPVVERVRSARRRIVERCGFDRKRLYAWIKEFESKHKERVIGYEPGKRAKGAPTHAD